VADAPGATASVAWTSPDEAEVEVRAPGHATESRRVVFRPEDRDPDRFRAIGLVVAAAVGNRGEEPPAPEPKDAVPHPRTVRQTTAWIAVGVLGGRGLAPGPPRYGGWLRAGYDLPGIRIPVFISLGIGYTVGARDDAGLRPSWTAMDAGAGLVLNLAALDLSVRPRIGVLLERVGVDAFDAHTGRADAGSRWLAGTGAGLNLTWPAGATVSALVGADLRFLSGGTSLHVDRDYVASFPALSYDFSLGVQISGSRSRFRSE
jgi:hypothetical protein